jgi:4'-phosphopantetheinyl transferase EntD
MNKSHKSRNFSSGGNSLPNTLVQNLLNDPRIKVEESLMNALHTEPAELWPAEQAAISNAGPKRRHEFAAGRILARRALARLGLDNVELGAGPDRVPIWPKGVIGSITHTHAWCAAAVARRKDFAAIGIDVEHLDALDDSLLEHVLTDNERGDIEALPWPERGSIASLVFSAKEAAFKAQYSISGQFLDFHAMEVILDLAGGRFRATLTTSVEPLLTVGHHFSGRFLRQGALVATAVTIDANFPDNIPEGSKSN